MPLALALLLSACDLLARDPLRHARELHEKGRFLESLEPLEARLESHPDDTEAHYLYGVACVRTNRSSLGLWSLRKALEDPEWGARAGFELAMAGLQSRDFPTALEAANGVLEREPEHLAALQLRTEARLGMLDYEAALADAERLLELWRANQSDPDLIDSPSLDGDEGNIELLRLRALIGLRRLEEAEEVFAAIEERQLEGSIEVAEPRYCAARATFASERGELELARERFEDCREQFPTDALVLERVLQFHDGLREFDRSLEILDETVEAEPQAAQVRAHLASRLRALERVEEAETLLLEGTLIEPAAVAAVAWQALAGHYFELEDFDASVAAWNEFLKRVPEPGELQRVAYAETLALAGRYERALEASSGLHPIYRDLVAGRVLLEQNRPAAALARLDAAIRLWPDNAVARYYAALAAERSGDFDRAILEYRDSIRSDPAATDAGLRLGRLHAAEGANEPARAALNHHLSTHPADVEAAILHYRVSSRLGQEPVTRRAWQLLVTLPEMQGRAVAEAAALHAKSGGPSQAAAYLREGAAQLDLTMATNADALRSLVVYLAEVGAADEALAHAIDAVEAQPGEARFHEIHGLALERSDAPEPAIRAAYTRALELDPTNLRALVALGKLERAAGGRQTAAELFDRAAAADSSDPDAAEIRREAAVLLASVGRTDDAERRLELLLEEFPHDGATAAHLVALRRARGDDSARTRQLARQADRFGERPATPRSAPAGPSPIEGSARPSDDTDLNSGA